MKNIKIVMKQMVQGYKIGYLKTIISLLILISSCNSSRTSKSFTKDTIKQAETKTDSHYLKFVKIIKEDAYSDRYATKLKGGFSISHHFDSIDQYIVYKKGEIIIDTIGDCSLGLPYKNLGYIAADFDKSFVFMQSFGSGNPPIIQLYEKETAQNLIEEFSAWIDVDTTK